MVVLWEGVAGGSGLALFGDEAGFEEGFYEVGEGGGVGEVGGLEEFGSGEGGLGCLEGLEDEVGLWWEGGGQEGRERGRGGL
jgi:hypothetical protein